MRLLNVIAIMTVVCVASITATAAPTDAPPTVTVKAQQAARPIYHSPQTPGYSAWTTLWQTPKGELRLAFQQVTGPVGEPAKRKNVTVILGSADEGETWKPVREVPARSAFDSPEAKIYSAPVSSAFCGHGLAVLKDGTLVTGLWAGDGDKSGYIQRSTDDGLTWSPPIYLRDPEIYKLYPTQIRQLRDGRLVAVAGMVKQADAKTAKFLLKEVFESRDDGKTWSHLWTMPADVGLCEESDFAELDNGDLLFSHRAEHYDGHKYLGSNRLQNIFHRKADKWEIGPVTAVPMPHSGFPELLKLKDGSVLHIGTDGIWYAPPDLHTWTRLPLPGSPYYPRAMQLKDGRVLVVGHIGSDDEYGKVDQTIVMQTFLLDIPHASAKAAAPTLTDFWQGNATWVADAEKIGSAFGLRFPSVICDAGELFAYYLRGYAAKDGKLKTVVGRAHGTDGLNWTDDGMVLDVGKTEHSWDDRIASFPGVWKDGDTWYMVYEGAAEDIPFSPGDIGLATSTDGKTFVKHPNNPILRHETTGWERVNIGTPSLFKENGVWYLFYHGYDGNVCQIGVASGKGLTDLTRSAANPILPVDSNAAAWDAGTTGRRSAIVKEGEYYYFAYEGSTTKPFETARWSSGLARAKNLTGVWEKFPRNPVIPQTATGFGYDGPELLRLGDTWNLYVRSPAADASQRFRLAARREQK